MGITIQDVQAHFDRYGWSYQEVEDKESLLTGFKGITKTFLLGAQIRGEWVHLSIPEYLPPILPEKRAEVEHHLLELNARIMYVKFALENDTMVTILADIPASVKLNYDLFSTAVDVIGFYADDAYPHLYELITGQPWVVQQDKTNE